MKKNSTCKILGLFFALGWLIFSNSFGMDSLSQNPIENIACDMCYEIQNLAKNYGPAYYSIINGDLTQEAKLDLLNTLQVTHCNAFLNFSTHLFEKKNFHQKIPFSLKALMFKALDKIVDGNGEVAVSCTCYLEKKIKELSNKFKNTNSVYVAEEILEENNGGKNKAETMGSQIKSENSTSSFDSLILFSKE